MIVKKFLHSCIYLESDNTSLIIDPGDFSFAEGKLSPSDLPQVDGILVTHQHSDHYFPPAIKTLLQKKQARIITNKSIAGLLANQGIKSEVLPPGKTLTIGSFAILGIQAPHGNLPVSAPENIGFLINDSVFHPGDSLEFQLPKTPKVLLLPIAAPWLTITNALAAAVAVKPEAVIPIHDQIIKEFMLTRMYGVCESTLKNAGIAFHPLQLGETFNA